MDATPGRHSGSGPGAAAWTAALAAAADDAIQRSLAEDLAGGGDVTSELSIPADARGRCVLRARGKCVVAGVPAIEQACATRSVRVAPVVGDGRELAAGGTVATLDGGLRDLLLLERTILNLLGALSGTATLTARFVERVRAAGSAAAVCATRKTIPGLRALQKYAVEVGGGDGHRAGLHDAVLLKDNHLAGLDPAGVAERAAQVGAAARARGGCKFVCCEVDSLEQLRALLGLPAGTLDIILLDNFTIEALREAVRLRGASAGSPRLEASGGVTLETIGGIAATGVDRISVGALTHSAPCIDFGLDEA